MTGLNREVEIRKASADDAAAILALQKRAYQSEAEIYNDYSIQPLRQTLDEIRQEFSQQLILKALIDGEIVGSVRGYMREGTCHIGKVIVEPAMQNKGIGKLLLKAIEDSFPEAERYELFTGFRSKRNLYLYQKIGYRVFKEVGLNEEFILVYLEKPNR